MIQLETKIKLPFLWGKASFNKRIWNSINLIVGPNGSGKTLLAEELKNQFEKKGYDAAFLRSDRTNEEELLGVLRTDSVVREKIEGVLSNMFGKSIRFEEKEDGSFVPIVVNKTRGVEYNLKEGECHGLKEILILLIALYGCFTKLLIVDEPELHLHPQFQQFFMNEIRRISESEPERIFFLVTHSPYFIDLRFAEDLLGVVVCHVNRIPTFIDELSDNDENLLRRFLPRFNTYHKQFFFSDNQVFVEGYTDQQMFSNLLSCVDNRNGTAGTGIIDVGGKDELGVFFKVCALLGTDTRIITDLDSLFCGKLREEAFEDLRPTNWLYAQEEKQETFYASLFTRRELESSVTLEKLVRRLEIFIVNIGKFVSGVDGSVSSEVDTFVEKVHELYDKYEKPESLDTFKTVVLQAVFLLGNKLDVFLPRHLAETIPVIVNLTNLILAAFESAKIFILSKGCIEHYYVESKVLYMPISGKDRLFHNELESMVEKNPNELKKNYAQLISILNRACARN